MSPGDRLNPTVGSLCPGLNGLTMNNQQRRLLAIHGNIQWTAINAFADRQRIVSVDLSDDVAAAGIHVSFSRQRIIKLLNEILLQPTMDATAAPSTCHLICRPVISNMHECRKKVNNAARLSSHTSARRLRHIGFGP